MALTITNLVRRGGGSVGPLRVVCATCLFDSSYAAGGESLTAAELGVPGGTVHFLIAYPQSGFSFQYDHTNQKLIARSGQGAHTHLENTAGTYTQNATTGAVTAATFNVGATEVVATTDLSGVTTRIFALVEGV